MVMERKSVCSVVESKQPSKAALEGDLLSHVPPTRVLQVSYSHEFLEGVTVPGGLHIPRCTPLGMRMTETGGAMKIFSNPNIN